jgi:CysZ protein
VTLGAGIRILIPTILIAIALFVIGFVPVVGQILVPVLGAFFGGWFLTLELTGLAFEGRGMTLKDRRIALRSRRARTLGFGVASYVSFLIPLGAVIMMPAAVAGATLLARSALGEDVSVPPRRQGRPAVDRSEPGRQD